MLSSHGREIGTQDALKKDGRGQSQKQIWTTPNYFLSQLLSVCNRKQTLTYSKSDENKNLNIRVVRILELETTLEETLETTSILTLSEKLMCMAGESPGHRQNQGQGSLYHSMVPSWLERIPGQLFLCQVTSTSANKSGFPGGSDGKESDCSA